MTFRGQPIRAGNWRPWHALWHSPVNLSLNKNISLTVTRSKKSFSFVPWVGLERRNRLRRSPGNQQGTEHGFEMQGGSVRGDDHRCADLDAIEDLNHVVVEHTDAAKLTAERSLTQLGQAVPWIAYSPVPICT